MEDNLLHNTFVAIDFGERRVGLAVGRRDTALAFPRITIDQKVCRDIFGEIQQLCKSEKADALVLGMPWHPEGKKENKTKEVKIFLKSLLAKQDLPVYLQDESYSSVSAHEKSTHLKKKKKQDKGRIDRMAAAIFLQEFLDNQGWQGIAYDSPDQVEGIQ